MNIFSFLLSKYLEIEWLCHRLGVDLVLLPELFPQWLYHFAFLSAIHKFWMPHTFDDIWCCLSVLILVILGEYRCFKNISPLLRYNFTYSEFYPF